MTQNTMDIRNGRYVSKTSNPILVLDDAINQESGTHAQGTFIAWKYEAAPETSKTIIWALRRILVEGGYQRDDD